MNNIAEVIQDEQNKQVMHKPRACDEQSKIIYLDRYSKMENSQIVSAFVLTMRKKGFLIEDGKVIGYRGSKTKSLESVCTEFAIKNWVIDEDQNEYLDLEVLNCVLRKIDIVRIPRDITPVLLKSVLCKHGALVSNINKTYEYLRTLEDVVLRENMHSEEEENAITIKYQHSKIGWGISAEGLTFYGDKSIGALEDSQYTGDFAIAPHGKLQNYIKMLKNDVFSRTELSAIVSTGCAATVLGYMNRTFCMNMYNPIVYLFGSSSTGKTTAAQLVASLGGMPDTGKNESVFLTFNGTWSSILKKLGCNNGYPICVDEFSMDRSTDISQDLYALADGSEKARLTRSGSDFQKSSTFESVIVANGEGSILNKTNKNGGLYARLFELEMIPWTESAEQANRIKKIVSENYGFITPMIAERLLSFTELEKELFLKNYDKWLNKFLKKATKENTSNSITSRVSGVLALFMISLELLLDILSIPESEALLMNVFGFWYENVILRYAETESLGIRAYDYLVEYFCNHRELFSENDSQVKGAIGNLYEFRELQKEKYGMALEFPKSTLEQILIKEGKFSDVRVCMKEIQKLGLLRTKGKERLDKSFPFKGVNITGYSIYLKGFLNDFSPARWNGKETED